jgi:hypothetical protein
MKKKAGSESGSISRRHESAYSDPDPYQNVMDPQQCFLGGEYSKKSVWDAVVENAKSRPHVDCEHLEGEQFIKAVAEYLTSYFL